MHMYARKKHNQQNELAANQNIFEANNYLMGDPALIFKADGKMVEMPWNLA